MIKKRIYDPNLEVVYKKRDNEIEFKISSWTISRIKDPKYTGYPKDNYLIKDNQKFHAKMQVAEFKYSCAWLKDEEFERKWAMSLRDFERLLKINNATYWGNGIWEADWAVVRLNHRQLLFAVEE